MNIKTAGLPAVCKKITVVYSYFQFKLTTLSITTSKKFSLAQPTELLIPKGG